MNSYRSSVKKALQELGASENGLTAEEATKRPDI